VGELALRQPSIFLDTTVSALCWQQTDPSSQAMAKEGGDPLQFQPLAGGLDVGFLAELGHRKLNEFGLRDDAVEIRGSFSCAGQHNVRTPSRAWPAAPLSHAPRSPHC